MNLKIKKYKDYIINTLAFGIYIGIQQLFLLPVLSRNLSPTVFASSILFLTILNVVSIAFGNELGNVYILKNKKNSYKVEKIYLTILLKISLLMFVISIVVSFFINNNVFLIFIVFALSNIKNFLIGILRKNNDYYSIMISNIFYCLGILLGIIFMFKTNNYIYSFLIGELFSLFFILYKSKGIVTIIRSDFSEKEIVDEYRSLSTVSLLLNGLSYLDRFLIFPILGANAMNSYYSTSALSKILSLLVNPINSVMMAKFSNEKSEISSKKFLNNIIIILIISIILSIIGSLLGLYILYNNYFVKSLTIVIPVGISSGLTITILLLKSIFLVKNGSKQLLTINFIYAVLLIFSSLILSYFFGLVGFAWANVISRLVQLYAYIRGGISS